MGSVMDRCAVGGGLGQRLRMESSFQVMCARAGRRGHRLAVRSVGEVALPLKGSREGRSHKE